MSRADRSSSCLRTSRISRIASCVCGQLAGDLAHQVILLLQIILSDAVSRGSALPQSSRYRRPCRRQSSGPDSFRRTTRGPAMLPPQRIRFGKVGRIRQGDNSTQNGSNRCPSRPWARHQNVRRRRLWRTHCQQPERPANLRTTLPDASRNSMRDSFGLGF